MGRGRERASELGRGRKWKRGGGRAGRGAQKGRGRADVAGERADVGAGARTWLDNARTWARQRRGIMGERLGTTDRWGRRDREGNEHAGERNSTDRPSPWDRERGREGALKVAPTGRTRLSGREGERARARTGLSGLPWAEIGFPFSREFLIAFLFIFSRVFNSNSNQVPNSNQIKYVQQFKEYLGSI
jgi:hypothetical protein